jgi:pimeloyl-ACP methyl ester carboxylesterase
MGSYISEEISFTDKGIRISGTLTLPKNEVNPCVILISGYGAETRDYVARGFNRYKFLAEELAKNEIASFRYDDRGCGKSSDVNWHNYTFDDLANEVVKIQSVLKDHHQATSAGNPSIHPQKIGLFGHSLGATIAPLAAIKSNDFTFVVSAAPHGLIGLKTAIHSRNSYAKVGGETPEEKITREKIISEILKQLQNEKTCNDALERLKQIMLEWYDQTSKEISFESYLQSYYEGILFTLGCTPMYRYFLNFNPQEIYQQLSCPILLFFAGNDLIHPIEYHREPIESVLSESMVTIHNFVDANHSFTKIDGEKAIGFVDNFTKITLEWMKNQFKI